MEKIEHLGIAVKNLEEAIPRYEKLFATTCYKRELVESQGVETAFFMVGPNKIELLGATTEDSPVAKFIAKKGEGIHHTAFAVADIRAEMKRLSSEGFRLLMDEPISGADNKIICFLHPKETNGVLIELCQDS
jgi:methylmalonyl-CoA/ethylmalonyl-CoA epimerase